MPVQRVALRDFTAFDEIELDLPSGIAVFLGENGTGKTHVLKAIYAVLKAAERLHHPTLPGMSVGFTELTEVFRPAYDDVERLRRRGLRSEPARHLFVQTSRFDAEVELGHLLFVTFREPRLPPGPEHVFLPTQDILAILPGLAAAYQSRFVQFDRTYRDAADTMTSPPLRDVPAIVAKIDALVGGAFYVDRDGQAWLKDAVDGSAANDSSRVRASPDLEAHLVGEGLRRLGALGLMLRNGTITPGMTLLWDEPDSALNPRLVSQLAPILVELAAWGVQVILSTHDYLLPYSLSLFPEYHLKPDVPIRFFGFHRASTRSSVTVEQGDTLADLAHNPILDEFTRHHDRERELFYGGDGEEKS